MKFRQIKTERRPNGVIACTIWHGNGYITFIRDGKGGLDTSGRTTSFEPGVYSEAVKEAYRQIESMEREAWAAKPLPGSVPRLA